MTVDELAQILRRMYDAGRPKGRQVTAIHLFGIKYAYELRHLTNVSFRQMCSQVDMSETYSTEINKGRNLAEYVEVVKDFP